MLVDIYNTSKKYSIIYADPPWEYNKGNVHGGAAKHYSLMKDTDIINLPIHALLAENCVLFIWATYPRIQILFNVLDGWGFKYKTIGFQWVKRNKINNKFCYGVGHWTRSNTEPCFIATRGHIRPVNTNISQVVDTPRGRHSAKPNVIRQHIVSMMGDLPRIELFARQATPGWDYWGNDVGDDTCNIIDTGKRDCGGINECI